MVSRKGGFHAKAANFSTGQKSGVEPLKGGNLKVPNRELPNLHSRMKDIQGALDALGQTVRQTRKTKPGNLALDRRDLPAGLYYVAVPKDTSW
jgi:hypothetical protein